ncbi:hypothetical protein [Pedobacter sp. MW01-1-1]|uniref:hypothetical protein n=1 Tax=Pedobacter sp. MW01-1-1 TaxID=3383027 RepID=UPI003FEE0B81
MLLHLLKFKRFTICAFLCITAFVVRAQNPGPNYACWTWNGNVFYGDYSHTATYSNWGGMYHYYIPGPKTIQGNYSGNTATPICGQVNYGSSGFVAVSPQTNCFINVNGNTVLGNLYIGNYTAYYATCTPDPNQLPLDSYNWLLLVAAGSLTVFMFRNKIENS